MTNEKKEDKAIKWLKDHANEAVDGINAAIEDMLKDKKKRESVKGT